MSGLALFIIAGSRFSYAIIAVCALFWVFMPGAFASTFLCGIASKTGRMMLNVMIASFAGSLFYLLIYLLNPLLAMETTLICALSPVFFMSSSFTAEPCDRSAGELFKKAAREPLALGGVTLAFSLIREPLGFATLSIPGGRGIIELFNSGGSNLYAVQPVSNSTGALLLLGYILIVFRRMNPDKDFR
jgi:hypothetical protein